MSRALKWLGSELLDVLPILVFFFLVFNVRVLTDSLVFGRLVASPLSELGILGKALVASKVVLLTDLLPFVDSFQDKPLIWSTCWKTVFYSIGAVVFRLLDDLFPLVARFRGLRPAVERLVADQDWPSFFGIQIWLCSLLLFFVATRELVIAVGGGRVVSTMFFTRGPAGSRRAP